MFYLGMTEPVELLVFGLGLTTTAVWIRRLVKHDELSGRANEDEPKIDQVTNDER
jgi:hypothetical protein